MFPDVTKESTVVIFEGRINSYISFVLCVCADHNRQEQADGGLFKSGGEVPPSSKPGEVPVTSQKPSLQPQPTPVEVLLPQLQHNSSGFEAFGVLVQYLVYSVSTTHYFTV